MSPPQPDRDNQTDREDRPARADREAFVEAVLRVVEQIPAGAVCTYGDVAELVGRGGPRTVGQVMSAHGAAVPWWRVIRADGRPVPALAGEALDRLRDEGAVIRGDRVDLRRSRWDGHGSDLD